MKCSIQLFYFCTLACLSSTWAYPEVAEASNDHTIFSSLNDFAPYRCTEQQSNTLYGVFLKKSEGPVSEDQAEAALSNHLRLEVTYISCDTERFPDSSDYRLWQDTTISRNQLKIQALQHIKLITSTPYLSSPFSFNEAIGRSAYIWAFSELQSAAIKPAAHERNKRSVAQSLPADSMNSSGNSIYLTKQSLFFTGIALAFVSGFPSIPSWLIIVAGAATTPFFIVRYHKQGWGTLIADKMDPIFTYVFYPIAEYFPTMSNHLWVYIGHHLELFIDTYFNVYSKKRE